MVVKWNGVVVVLFVFCCLFVLFLLFVCLYIGKNRE